MRSALIPMTRCSTSSVRNVLPAKAVAGDFSVGDSGWRSCRCPPHVHRSMPSLTRKAEAPADNSISPSLITTRNWSARRSRAATWWSSVCFTVPILGRAGLGRPGGSGGSDSNHSDKQFTDLSRGPESPRCTGVLESRPGRSTSRWGDMRRRPSPVRVRGLAEAGVEGERPESLLRHQVARTARSHSNSETTRLAWHLAGSAAMVKPRTLLVQPTRCTSRWRRAARPRSRGFFMLCQHEPRLRCPVCRHNEGGRDGKTANADRLVDRRR